MRSYSAPLHQGNIAFATTLAALSPFPALRRLRRLRRGVSSGAHLAPAANRRRATRTAPPVRQAIGACNLAGALGSCAFGRFNRLGEQAQAVADARVELGLIDDFAASSLNDLSLAADFLDAEIAKLKPAASEVAEAEFERSVESFGGFKSPTGIESRRLFFKFD